MVQALLRFMHRELKGVHQAALFLAVSAAGSVVLALVRDRLLASSFGAGPVLDLYFAAFRIPDIVYTISLFFTASTALIPLFLDLQEQGADEAQRFLDSVFTSFLLFTCIIASFAFFLIPVLIPIIVPGFSAAEQHTLVTFSRILLLSPLLLGLSNLVSSIIQSHRRFLVYALSPLFYNLGIIVGVVWFYRVMGVFGLAAGVILGALLHLLVQIPTLAKLRYIPRLTAVFSSSLMRRVVTLSFPRALGLSINQIVLLIMTALASAVGAGGIAVFHLAYNLQSVPLSVIGVSYSVAVFPTLARSFVRREQTEFMNIVALALRHILFWSLFATVFFIVLRAHIVRVVLGAGAFGWLDTRLTAAAFGLFASSLLAQGAALLFVRAFYAAGRTRIPIIINAVTASFITVVSLALLRLTGDTGGARLFFGKILRVEDIASLHLLVLPFAFSLGAFVNALLLYVWFRRTFGVLDHHFTRSVLQALTAALCAGGTAYLTLRLSVSFFDTSRFIGILSHGSLAALAGAVAGVLLLRALRNRELAEITSALQKRFWRSSVIAPEPEKLP